jgi:di/tricarboxylate transporter
MFPIDRLKLVIMVVAIAIWAYGVHTSSRPLMLVGIAFVVVAFLLRFVGRRDRSNGDRDARE